MAEQLLINGNFDGGVHHATRYWVAGNDEPQTTEFDNILVPIGWTAWWYEGFPEPGAPESGRVTGRPEYKVIGPEFVDQTRILSGKAVMYHANWRALDAGWMQRVKVTPGATYRFSCYMHAFYSDMSDHWHGPPRGKDGSLLDWAHCYQSVGIDPTGGLDPIASTVWRSNPVEIYGKYGDWVDIEVSNSTTYITVFLLAWCTHALTHCDIYADNARLEQIDGPEPPEPTRSFDVTTVLMGPGTTKPEAHELIDLHWNNRYNYGFSADHAAARAREAKSVSVLAFKPNTWPSSLPGFFEEHYKDNIDHYEEITLGEPEPPDPDPDPITLWQRDPLWRDARRPGDRCTTTIGQDGCWETCCAMAQRWYKINENATPVTVNEALGPSAFTYDCQILWASMPDALGIRVLSSTTSLARVDEHLSIGGVCFAEVTHGAGKHFVFVPFKNFAIDRYLAHDPWTGEKGFLTDLYPQGAESWRLVAEAEDQPDPPNQKRRGVIGATIFTFGSGGSWPYFEGIPLMALADAIEASPYQPLPGVLEPLSIHMQGRSEKDIEYIARIKPAVVKSVLNMEWGQWVKQASPGTAFLFRQYINHQGRYWDLPPDQGAREFVATFRDSLERNADTVDYVEPLNEMIATEDWAGIQRTVAFDVAFCEELERIGLPARPVVLTSGVGNPQHGAETELLVPALRAAARVGGAAGPHTYFGCAGTYTTMTEHWRHYAGRPLESWDVTAREHGVYVDYIFGETGAVYVAPNGSMPSAEAGWRWKECLAGNWPVYLERLMEMRRRYIEWNRVHAW